MWANKTRNVHIKKVNPWTKKTITHLKYKNNINNKMSMALASRHNGFTLNIEHCIHRGLRFDFGIENNIDAHLITYPSPPIFF